MNKVYALIFLSLLASCSIEESTDELVIAELRTNTSCDLEIEDPFSGSSLTYGSTDSGCNLPSWYDHRVSCFSELLRVKINQEYARRFSTVYRPSSSISGEPGLTIGNHPDGLFSNIGVPPGDFYPEISASDANIVIEYIICQIDTHIDTLPSLPSGQMYHPIIDYISVDHTSQGTSDEDSFIDIQIYDIGIYQ